MKTRRNMHLLLVLFILWISIATACKNKKFCCSEIEKDFCFKSDRGWFSRILRASPKCPSKFNPTFTLFTRDGPTAGVPISQTNIPQEYSNNRNTTYLVHGWMVSFDREYSELKDALLDKADHNVIGVDWRKGAKAITYLPSAANTQSIGALIGSLTNVLRSQPGSNPFFWCIGHSLGAHACGYTSLTARPLMDRITGLDPAGPSFSNKGLMKTDALYVDIIHTDALWGSHSPRGDVDFYPNGGRRQPGCSSSQSHDHESQAEEMSDEEKIDIMGIEATVKGSIGCSHQMAMDYMLNSIKYTSCFVANYECSDYKDMPASCRRIGHADKKGVMGYDALMHRYDGYLYFVPGSDYPHCSRL